MWRKVQLRGGARDLDDDEAYSRWGSAAAMSGRLQMDNRRVPSAHVSPGMPRSRWALIRILLEVVQADGVVPEYLALARIAERQREEAVHGVRILRVAVGVIGGGDEQVVADRVDDLSGERFVALDGAEGLAPEILRRRHA